MNYSLLIILLPYSSQLSCSLFNWSLKAINLVFSISCRFWATSSPLTSISKSLTIILPSLSTINLNSNLSISFGRLTLISPVTGLPMRLMPHISNFASMMGGSNQMLGDTQVGRQLLQSYLPKALYLESTELAKGFITVSMKPALGASGDVSASQGGRKAGPGGRPDGEQLREKLVKNFLTKKKQPIEDLGCFSLDAVDYPDYARLLSDKLKNDFNSQGILFCGTGIGISMAANRFSHIRAALCTTVEMASKSRKHNDANVLALGGRIITNGLAMDIVYEFLNTDFEAGRHLLRVNKI